MSAAKAIIAKKFAGNPTAKAAAMNEIIAAETYPSFMAAVAAEYPGETKFEAIVKWSIRRGMVWS